MRQVGRLLVVCCVTGILILGAGLSAVESQGKERTTRPARLYFLREKGVLGGMSPAPEVKVDGTSVGTIGNGASGAPLQDLAVLALVGGKGQPMQAKSPLRAALAGPIFYRLEPAAGAAEIQHLKTP